VLGVDVKTIDRAIAKEKLHIADRDVYGDRVLIHVADLRKSLGMPAAVQ
jgi:hypothetical protein